MSITREDLAGLTHEQLVELVITRKIQEAVRERMALKLFEANPGPQTQFQRDQHRLRFMFGGNRTGKSEIGGVEALRFATGKHPFRPGLRPTSGWVISPSFEVQRESAQDKVLRYLPTTGWQGDGKPRIIYRDRARGYIDRIELPTKPAVTITFKSVEQGRESFQGASVSWVWVDEEMPIDIYKELLMRIMDVQGNLFGTMTPLIGDLYSLIVDGELAEDPELKFWHMTWDDNPYLDEDEKKRLYAALTEEEQEARVYGRFVPREGLVFRRFMDSVHVIDSFELEPTYRTVLGLDYGIRSPVAGVFVALDAQGRAIVYDEYYLAEQPIPVHIKNLKGKPNMPKRRLADPALWNRERDMESVAGEFGKNGLYLIPAPRGTNMWKARVDRIRDCLDYERVGLEWGKRPVLYIMSHCVNLIRELRKLAWKPSRSGAMHEDTKGPDHAIDALAYALEDLAPSLGRGGASKITVHRSKRKPRNSLTGY